MTSSDEIKLLALRDYITKLAGALSRFVFTFLHRLVHYSRFEVLRLGLVLRLKQSGL